MKRPEASSWIFFRSTDGWKPKSKASRVYQIGKAGHGGVRGHLPLSLAGHLLGQAAVEEGGVGEILLAGLLEQGLDSLL